LNTLNAPVKPWYREPWPWILMSGPLIVVIAGVATAWLAFRHNDGLVAEDYYKQGLTVNQVLERESVAQRLGLRADLMHSGVQLRVRVTGGGEYREPAALKLRIVHPTRAGGDQVVILRPDGQGFFAGKLDRVLAGRWTVTLEDETSYWRLQGKWHADAEGAQQLLPDPLAGEAPGR